MASKETSRARRDDLRRKTIYQAAEAKGQRWRRWREQGLLESVCIAVLFFLLATLILSLRTSVMRYRPGQWVQSDILSRVQFSYNDPKELERLRVDRADQEPRVYRSIPNTDIWGNLEQSLLALPDRIAEGSEAGLPDDLRNIFDGASITALRRYVSVDGHKTYAHRVNGYVQALRDYRILAGGQKWPIYIINGEDRRADLRAHRDIRIDSEGVIDPERTFAPHSDDLRAVLADVAQSHFLLSLQPKIVDYSLSVIGPNYQLDLAATKDAQEAVFTNGVASDAGLRRYPADYLLVPGGKALDADDCLLLRAENQQYLASIKSTRWASKLGTALFALIMTIMISGYIIRYQPRIVTNHMRAVAIAGLLLAMLLLDQLAGLSTGPIFLFGTAPTLLVAMILTIAYDQRFGLGISSMHGVLATLALNEGVPFFTVIFVGVLVICFLLDEIRTRSKLIEVGGAASLAMVVATAAAGFSTLYPAQFVLQNALYAGASGLTVGFVVLGILPFIEKSFRITTSMTLLELADASQPLLRRLATEAPGTNSHSQQVALLAEAAAEAIGANSLLCRVASYYHDVGKMNKAEYFVENQSGGESRHLNLSPNVSLMIITGHVRDGVELAHEYNLPTSIIPFIQQHHGTTLVEFFYRQAVSKHDQQQPDMPAISEHQFRYPGPKPRTREVAVVMLADAVESATRTLVEPNASRVEALVHDLAMKRLLDGQFDECGLTMRDLERMERSMVKSLLAIYHGRIAYPSTAAIAAAPSQPASQSQSIRLA